MVMTVTVFPMNLTNPLLKMSTMVFPTRHVRDSFLLSVLTPTLCTQKSGIQIFKKSIHELGHQAFAAILEKHTTLSDPPYGSPSFPPKVLFFLHSDWRTLMYEMSCVAIGE